MIRTTDRSYPPVERVEALILAGERGHLTVDDTEELEGILHDDAEARRFFARYMVETVSLRDWAACVDAGKVAFPFDNAAMIGRTDPEHEPDVTVPPVASLRFLNNAGHGTTSVLFQGWPLAYLLATVTFAIGLCAGGLIPVSHPTQTVQKPSPSTMPSQYEPEPQFVAQISGMADCRWSKDGRPPYGFDAVPVGRRFKLDSGLLEITYRTGARVVLQGPVTYEVESPSGGYLSIGKLTARLEEKSEVGGQKSEVRNQKSESANQKSEIGNHQFAVRTPTALVTDLGTEFGVRVDANGQNDVHVFQGKVRFETMVRDGKTGRPTTLILEQGAGVSSNSVGLIAPRSALDAQAARATFVRRIPRSSDLVDLLDIVAGGNGSMRQRERGIDTVTGDPAPVFLPRWRNGDGRYHRVPERPLLDGVFVPEGRNRPVQIDSAGHTFDGFGETTGRTFGVVWARAADLRLERPDQKYWFWIYAMGKGTEYMPSRRGMLMMHANSGITFDLEKIGKLRSGRAAWFHGVAGAPRSGSLNLYLFVDGQVVLNHARFAKTDGPTTIDLPIPPGSRFLTLAVSDGGDGDLQDRLVLGDASLQISPEEGGSQ